ncbi:MAG: hypothetical protein KDB61_13165, partial [Planctomycetes bacterium]|nr:hypothetical protein [Planctomycetota bacterium]
KWESRRGASVPAGSRLMQAWNGRIVHGDGTDPYSWIMSAIGDHTDYDLSPTIPTAIQAVSSTLVEGNTQSNDVLTAIIPITDDLLIFGGRSTISRLTGDPLAGGVLDSITRGMGIAHGSAWTHMPDGSVIVFTNPAGVWRISGGGTRLEDLSKNRIEADLETIDQSKYRIKLTYSRALRGLCVIPVPLDLDMEFDGRWWFMDEAGAWWPMRWADRTVQPTSVSDGRANRDPLFGCFDGAVRTLSGDATDDGYEYPWFWIIGPFWDRQWGKLQRWSRPFLRFSADGPVEWYAYASSGPLQIGLPDSSGSWAPGEVRPAGGKWKGKAFWLEIRGFGVHASIEHATINQHQAGRTK